MPDAVMPDSPHRPTRSKPGFPPPDRARRVLPPLLAGLLALGGCAPLAPGLAVSPGTLSDRWEVRFDPESRTPVRMTNRTLEEPTGTSGAAASDSLAEAAALAVFHEYPEWFRLRGGIDGFRRVRGYASGFLRLIRLEQTYRGLPVAGAGYEVRVLPGGRVGTIEGRFHPEIVIDTAPVLGAAQAEDRARAGHPPGAAPRLPYVAFENLHRFRDVPELLVIPERGLYRLAWAVRLRTDTGWSRVYVDARSGDLIAAQYLGNFESYGR